jgi:Uma2 family endonuclease
VLVPDFAGWRRGRLPTVPPDAHPTLAADWVCEILSPYTEALDRGKKLQRYALEGVGHAWLIEPLKQRLEVLSPVSGPWERLALHEERAKVRVPPFDAVELELGLLWI